MLVQDPHAHQRAAEGDQEHQHDPAADDGRRGQLAEGVGVVLPHTPGHVGEVLLRAPQDGQDRPDAPHGEHREPQGVGGGPRVPAGPGDEIRQEAEPRGQDRGDPGVPGGHHEEADDQAQEGVGAQGPGLGHVEHADHGVDDGPGQCPQEHHDRVEDAEHAAGEEDHEVDRGEDADINEVTW